MTGNAPAGGSRRDGAMTGRTLAGARAGAAGCAWPFVRGRENMARLFPGVTPPRPDIREPETAGRARPVGVDLFAGAGGRASVSRPPGSTSRPPSMWTRSTARRMRSIFPGARPCAAASSTSTAAPSAAPQEQGTKTSRSCSGARPGKGGRSARRRPIPVMSPEPRLRTHKGGCVGLGCVVCCHQIQGVHHVRPPVLALRDPI